MQAILFDLDGTLCDSRPAIFWQFAELTREFDGVAATKEVIAQAAHGTTDAIIRSLVHNTRVPFADIVRRHSQLRVESVALCQLYPGVDELLPILRRLGLHVAAVTAGNQHNITYLQNAGIHQHFEAIITADDVAQAKPHPEGLLLALRRMGIEPSAAAMIGDTPADINAGKNASVAKTIGITHGFGTLEALRAAQPDHIVHDIPSLLDVLE